MSMQTYLWKQQETSQEILNEVRQTLKELQEDLTNGHLLFSDTNEKLIREYVFSLGKIEGLKYLEKLLTEVGGDEDAANESAS